MYCMISNSNSSVNIYPPPSPIFEQKTQSISDHLNVKVLKEKNYA